MTDNKVLDVMREAVYKDGEILLVTSGKNKGVLTNVTSKANKQAFEVCKDTKAGLFEYREEKKGRATRRYVRLTEKGIRALIDSLDISDYPDLIKNSAPSYRATISQACIPALRRAQQEAFEAERAQWQESVDMVSTRLNHLDDQRRAIEEAIQNSLEFQNRLEKMRPQPPTEPTLPPDANARTVSEQPKSPGRQRPPADLDQAESAYEYQRSLCEDLVQAWEYASHPDAIEELEYCLLNAGLEPTSEVGKIVPFNAIDHDTEDDVKEGDPVEILRPGWSLPLAQFGRNEEGEVYQLCKAVVRSTTLKEPPPVSSVSEGSH